VVSAQLAEELPDVTDEQVGASMAAKWPPRPNSDQCTSVFELDSAPDRHIQGEHRDPVGTVERSLAPQASGVQQIPVHRVLGQFRLADLVSRSASMAPSSAVGP
jgi:hypothetical protein